MFGWLGGGRRGPRENRHIVIALPDSARADTDYEDGEAETTEERTDDETIDLLRERFQALTTPEPFAVGDIVTWKTGLRNRRFPGVDTPAIVTKVLGPREAHVNPEESALRPFYREPLDLVIGFLDEDDDFAEVYVDSRRITHWEELPEGLEALEGEDDGAAVLMESQAGALPFVPASPSGRYA